MALYDSIFLCNHVLLMRKIKYFLKDQKNPLLPFSNAFFLFQYLIKYNEIKTKKGIDLLQSLVEYYHAQTK